MLSLALINENKLIQAREVLAKCIAYHDFCTDGILNHLMKLKGYDFSVTTVQKILRQISKNRLRCALLELLKSSLFKQEAEYPEKVRSWEQAVNLYAKYKKKDRLVDSSADLAQDDWKAILPQVYSALILLLSDMMGTELAKYYSIACIDTLSFGLKHQELLSREHTVDGIRLMVGQFTQVQTDLRFCEWRQTGEAQSASYQQVVEAFAAINLQNQQSAAYLQDFVLEVKHESQPYLDSKPLLVSMTYTYMSNLNRLLPSLSASILHKTFDAVCAADALFTFTLPSKLLATLCKVVEKIIVICQADLKASVHFLSTLIVVQTVLNNPNYRQKVEKSFTAGDEVPLQPKEMLALYLQMVPAEVVEELIISFNSVWETLKTKYIFLISMAELKSTLGHLNKRLRELMVELENQVLTPEFREFEATQRQLDSSQLHELKFEKIKHKQESQTVLSSKDIVKTKIEYLKNFRDIFGEFEYYLELIDCISANLNEKLNLKQSQETKKPQDITLDSVSKKLICNFASSGLQLNNVMDGKFWELFGETVDCVCAYLLTFLKDAVFIDYFQSSWVILCNFLQVSEDRRSDKLNSVMHLILSAVEKADFSAGKMPNLHVIKCIHYILDYTSKVAPVAFDPSLNDLLVRFMPKLFHHSLHTQNSDLVRLLRLLLAKYSAEVNSKNVREYFKVFVDVNFDIDSDNGAKLLDQFLDICASKEDCDQLFSLLINLLLSLASTASLQRRYARLTQQQRAATANPGQAQSQGPARRDQTAEASSRGASPAQDAPADAADRARRPQAGRRDVQVQDEPDGRPASRRTSSSPTTTTPSSPSSRKRPPSPTRPSTCWQPSSCRPCSPK